MKYEHPYKYFIETLSNGKFRVRVQSKDDPYNYINAIYKGNQRDYYYEYQLVSEANASTFLNKREAENAIDTFDRNTVKPVPVESEEYIPSKLRR